MSMNKERIKKLKQRLKNIKDATGNNAFLFVKADETIRVRALPVDENEEFAMEIIHFYLGPDIKGVVSPQTLGLPCAIYEKYNELSESEDDYDKELAKKIKPKKKYVIPVVKMVNNKSSVVDTKVGVRLLQVSAGVYQAMVNYSLDSEHGDFTDVKEGYDLKITRTGKGQFDTEYAVINCKESPLDPKYASKVFNTAELLKKELPSYERTQEILRKFLGDDAEPKKKKKAKPETAPTKKKHPDLIADPTGKYVHNPDGSFKLGSKGGRLVKKA